MKVTAADREISKNIRQQLIKHLLANIQHAAAIKLFTNRNIEQILYKCLGLITLGTELGDQCRQLGDLLLCHSQLRLTYGCFLEKGSVVNLSTDSNLIKKEDTSIEDETNQMSRSTYICLLHKTPR